MLAASPGLAAPPRLPVPPPPRVDPADQLIEDAAASSAQGHLEAACAKLEESRKLRRASRTLLLLARCYWQLGKQASAWRMAKRAATVASSEGNPGRRDEAQALVRAYEPYIVNLTIWVPTAALVEGLEIRFDGVKVEPKFYSRAIAVDGGHHELTASAPSRTPWSTSIDVRAGENAETTVPTLDLPSPAQQPAQLPTRPVAPPPAAPTESSDESGESREAESNGEPLKRVTASLTTTGIRYNGDPTPGVGYAAVWAVRFEFNVTRKFSFYQSLAMSLIEPQGGGAQNAFSNPVVGGRLRLPLSENVRLIPSLEVGIPWGQNTPGEANAIDLGTYASFSFYPNFLTVMASADLEVELEPFFATVKTGIAQGFRSYGAGDATLTVPFIEGVPGIMLTSDFGIYGDAYYEKFVIGGDEYVFYGGGLLLSLGAVEIMAGYLRAATPPLSRSDVQMIPVDVSLNF
jgi:hypothetical protein